MPQLWAGLDIGKKNHYAVVIDADGKRLLSRRQTPCGAEPQIVRAA
ncbi:IS110 family transposase [Streptomyces sp. NBC_00053]|nr:MULTISPECIES: hypothetical protein [unclassified Streptomyces]MCX5105292.1 IS110 family transposase [Streptomyces sp. NBC_00439]MCX5503775.1 IS110 family transposase [Streptomyces sp. NBC_00052]MCX5547690.1 IS110 family transposase [Streptomyces sp. NBC_00051]